jgi:hypothetical protein
MDDGDPRGHIAPCLLREAHRQAALAHVELITRSLERLKGSSSESDWAAIDELIEIARVLWGRIDQL